MMNDKEIRAKVQAERIDDWGVDSVNWALLEKHEGVGFEDVGELGLKSNQLTYIPDSLGNLVNLTELSLTKNPIKPMTETEMIAAYGEVVSFLIIEAIRPMQNRISIF